MHRRRNRTWLRSRSLRRRPHTSACFEA